MKPLQIFAYSMLSYVTVYGAIVCIATRKYHWGALLILAAISFIYLIILAIHDEI